MRLGSHHSEETKNKLATQKLGRKLTPEHRAKVLKTLKYGTKGHENSFWKGGISANRDGYILILMRDHPKAYSNGYIKRATLVAEKKYMRQLVEGEVVHHVNGIKDDDRPENLEILSENEHNSLTAKERWAKGEMHRILPQIKDKK